MPRSSDDLIPTQRSLISALKNMQDSQSWQKFFNTYWRLIYHVALKAGLTEVEAQEVVQETLISVSKSIPDFKYDPARGSFKGWLMTLTRWRITDQVRKRHPEHQRSAARPNQTARTATIERIPDPAGLNLDAVWEEEWKRNVMDAAIDRVKRQVNAKQYQIFDCYVVKKWPVEKVTATLGVTTTQVYLAKHRVSGLIKKVIKDLETKII